MSGNVYQFSGDDAETVTEMIALMAQYLGGPGLDGFLAWIDPQQIPCGCGKPHAPSRDVIRRNLAALGSKIEEVFL